MITVASDKLDLILKLIVPVVVAVVTKAAAPARLKAAVTIVLAAVVALLTANRVDTGQAVMSFATVQAWAVDTMVAVFAYLGLWKPIVDVNARMFPGKGLG